MPDFTGRARPRETLIRMLDGDGAPPVSLIVGQPGVGSSILAVHAAHAATPRFPDECTQLLTELSMVAASPEPSWDHARQTPRSRARRRQAPDGHVHCGRTREIGPRVRSAPATGGSSARLATRVPFFAAIGADRE